VNPTANRISRWETATCKPSISNLERLARFIGLPITVVFPKAEPKARTNALPSTTVNVDDQNLEVATLYAQSRRARRRNKTRWATRPVALQPPRHNPPGHLTFKNYIRSGLLEISRKPMQHV
jgi:transcriptional regulator with XRE-family HTH domain